MSTIAGRIRRFRRFEIGLFDCPRHVFPRHSHDEFVISANIAGRENVTLDRQSHDVTTDQLTLYNPGRVQGSRAASSEWSFASVYVAPGDVAALTGYPDEIVFEEAFPHAPELAAALIAFVRAGLGPGAEEEGAELALAGLLVDLLAVSGADVGAPEAPPPRALRTVAERLVDEIADPPAVGELAREHGTTPVGLVRSFARAYGLPPQEWLNAQRILRARELLRAGRPVAEVAHALGYADQAHFTRRFKAATGVTPGAFAQVK